MHRARTVAGLTITSGISLARCIRSGLQASPSTLHSGVLRFAPDGLLRSFGASPACRPSWGSRDPLLSTRTQTDGSAIVQREACVAGKDLKAPVIHPDVCPTKANQ